MYHFKGPAVITQWPSVEMDYGPTESWEELYIIYSPSLLNSFLEQNYFNRLRPIWEIKQSNTVRSLLKSFSTLANDIESINNCDRLDRLAERLIMESIIGAQGTDEDSYQHTILEISEHLEDNLNSNFEIEALAKQYNLSPATFRRHWSKHMKASPASYFMSLKISEASRLLVETDKKVYEIAESLAFNDPLYFSRKFKQCTGKTARQYRILHQKDLL